MDVRTFPRKPEAPEQGWFQIGEVPEQTPPRRHGHGRVSLAAGQQDHDTEALPKPRRTPALVRANRAAGGLIERIIEVRYGALALCVAALLLLVVAVAAIGSHGTGDAAAETQHHSDVGALTHARTQIHREHTIGRRERAQITALHARLRTSRTELTSTRRALARADHRLTNRTHRQHQPQRKERRSVHRPA